MEKVLYISDAKDLRVSQGLLAITSKEDEVITLHPQDIQSIVIENIYANVSIPFLLKCVKYAIPIIICNRLHHPQIYCLDGYRHTELLSILQRQIHWQADKKRRTWIFQRVMY